ncbi:MAG: tricarballylate dehydrogenase [Alphaproteobacteria bacterium]|nr:tricarballylate dehydrogenase [Alphaproteobacteria bacterium]
MAGKNIVVIGQGAAGLSAALAAAEAARTKNLAVTVTLIDKAPEQDAGGNTRWTPSYMRMASVDRVEPSFVHDMLEATKFQGDETYFATLAVHAPGTVKWIAGHGVPFHQPTYYLAKGPPRIQPVGGGETIHRELSRAARDADVVFRHSCAADAFVADNGAITGVRLSSGETLPADAAILACGGFQANAAMMRAHFGPDGASVPLLAPRAHFNSGDGIRMALSLGADFSGERDGMHIEPVDPRSKNQAPVVLLYPYGIVVDREGLRFFDEGAGLVHETWEAFSRRLHFEVPGRMACAILDARVRAIPDWQRAIRSEVPPFEAGTLAELARLIGVDGAGLARTVTAYNAACTGDPRRFDATISDGLAASPALTPPKSNWARAISEPPFLAWPLVGAIAYTFGGLATDTRARVLRDGSPIPGLYAAGEITGHFYATAPNAVSVLRAFVFGRIAGREAVAALSA